MPPKKRAAKGAAKAAPARKTRKTELKSKAQNSEQEKPAPAAKKQRKAKPVDPEEEALKLRAEKVVSLLTALDKKSSSTCSDTTVEPIYQGDAENTHAAARAVFNAVECGDRDRVERILKAHRKLVDSDGKLATQKQLTRMLECEAQGKSVSDEGLLQGLKWRSPFACPVSKIDANRNAIAVALHTGDMDMVKVLTWYFGWTSVLGDPKTRQQAHRGYRMHQSTCLNWLVSQDIPEVSFNLLISKGDMFLEKLPRLVSLAMRCGNIKFVRRALRYYLGLSTSLDEAISVPQARKKGVKRMPSTLVGAIDPLGVTYLHCMALEAQTEKEFVGLELNATTTNAPALGVFITPMHLAALSGNGTVYQHLEKAGGDWTINSDDNLYALQYAAAAPPSPFGGTPDRNTPDYLAAFEKALRPSETLKIMTTNLPEELEHEFQYNMKEKRSTLEVAIRAGRNHNVAFLLHWFDEKDATQWYPYNGESTIINAALKDGTLETLEILFMVPKFQKSFRSDGSSYVSTIVNLCRGDLLHTVIDQFKDDPEVDKITLQCTPVHLQTAIATESLPMVRSIVEEGNVDLNSKENTRSALHVSCEMDFVECSKYLISKGACTRSVSRDGVSIMQHACRHASKASILLLLESGVTLDLKAEKAKFDRDEEERKKKESKKEEMDVTEDKSPFEGWFMVLTGVFSVSKDVIKNVVESNGGRIQAAVNSKTTHCVYSGRDGFTDYGQKMGKGDSKYKAAKKKKLPFLKEEDILRYLKSSGQSIMAREGINDPAKSGLNEASFLHDVIKHSKVQTEGTSQVTSIEILLQHGADVTVVDDLRFIML
eukprot:m.307172 g.307172  ORF g.307172 m.307172 type:complete len:826 (-) comp16457_c0_seq36:4819-7296(-)